jgi:hypothetical protein
MQVAGDSDTGGTKALQNITPPGVPPGFIDVAIFASGLWHKSREQQAAHRTTKVSFFFEMPRSFARARPRRFEA